VKPESDAQKDKVKDILEREDAHNLAA